VELPPPSPALIMSGLMAHQVTYALIASIELGIYTAIESGATTVAELAAACGASEKGTRVLCDYLCVHGYLSKAEGRYANTADTAVFLVKSSPAYMGSIVEFLASPELMASHADITTKVRDGGCRNRPLTDHAEEQVWERFASSMRPVVGHSAQAVAELLGEGEQPWKVLDVSSSHGLFGISVAARHKNAQIYANDWPEVVVYSKASADRAGMGDRYHTIPGSAFEVDFGTEFDVVLVPNFLHHFSAEANTDFLAKCRSALKPGGRVVVVEFVVEEDRLSPGWANTFAMQMLGATPEGDCYTQSELTAMLTGAGFQDIEVHAEHQSPSRIFVGIS